MTDVVVKTEVVIDTISEATILVVAIVDKAERARLVRRLLPDHFLDHTHKRIWIGLTAMAERDLDYDHATLRALAGHDIPIPYVEQLLQHKPDAFNVDFHVRKIQWQKARAEACAGPLTQLLDVVRKPHEDPERVRALARQIVRALDEGGDDLRHLRSSMDIVREAIMDMDEKEKGKAIYPFGIDCLDFYEEGSTMAPAWMPRDERGRVRRIIPGPAPAMVTVLTGTSGSGKSFVGKYVALAQAGRKRRVLYGAWEEESHEVLQEMAAIGLGVSRSLLRSGGLPRDDRRRVDERMEAISEWVKFLDYPFSRQPSAAKDAAPQALRNMDILQAAIDKSACDVCVCDLFDRALDSDDPRIAKPVLFRVQQIAKETGSHMLLLAQQKLKELEQRKDKRPTRDNIIGSQAWVDIADHIFGVHRPSLFKAVADNVLELIILKQRRAPWPMIVEFGLDLDRGRITGGSTRPFDQGGEASDEMNGFGVKVKGGRGGPGFSAER